MSVPAGFDPERTLGPEVGAVATLAGFPPDPEQQFCLDVSFALDKRGEPLVFDSTIIAPRQNLKTGFLKQRALGKLFVTNRRLVVWSAHEFTTATEAAGDLEELIDGSDMLRRRVRLTNRDEVAKHGTTPQIELQSGARLIFKTRTSGGGRGLSGDDLFVDEAFAAQAAQMGAVMPIMLARRGSQVDFASSACRPESTYLWNELVVPGRAGAGPRSFYIEWCAPPPDGELPDGSPVCTLGAECDHAKGRPGCGCDRPEVVVIAHTAVTRGRIELQKVMDMRRKMPAGEYAREIMGWHDEVVDEASEAPFTVAEWNECLLRTDLDPPEEAPEDVSVFAVEMDVDRAFASIAAAGRMDDGRPYVEFVERKRGRGWVVPYCKRIDARVPGAVFAGDGGGPAESLLDDLDAEGLTVVRAATSDVVQACGDMVDAVADRTLVHGPQYEMEAAVEGSRKRPLGDRGFTFGRRASDDDAAPLLAAAIAMWAVDEAAGPSLW